MPRPSLREQIVDAALNTLYRQGFNGSGVQEITDAARVPKGSFYNHFESKEAIAIAALDRYWEGAHSSLDLLRDESAPPLERLRRYFEALTAVMVKSRYRKGCMIGNFATELSDQSPAIRKRLAAIFAEWSKAIGNCIDEAKRSGSVRRDIDAGLTAGFLLNAWEGTVLRAKVDKNDNAYKQFMAVTFTAILG